MKDLSTRVKRVVKSRSLTCMSNYFELWRLCVFLMSIMPTNMANNENVATFREAKSCVLIKLSKLHIMVSYIFSTGQLVYGNILIVFVCFFFML